MVARGRLSRFTLSPVSRPAARRARPCKGIWHQSVISWPKSKFLCELEMRAALLHLPPSTSPLSLHVRACVCLCTCTRTLYVHTCVTYLAKADHDRRNHCSKPEINCHTCSLFDLNSGLVATYSSQFLVQVIDTTKVLDMNYLCTSVEVFDDGLPGLYEAVGPVYTEWDGVF